MTDFLDEKRQEITHRLEELKPLVEEYHRLEAAAAWRWMESAEALAPQPTAPGLRRTPPARQPRQRPRGSRRTRKVGRQAASRRRTKAAAATAAGANRGARKRRAGRRKGSGTRAAEALSFVQGQPGITIPELAAKMGIKQNYLYRVLPGLEQEEKVAKQGRGWHPKG